MSNAVIPWLKSAIVVVASSAACDFAGAWSCSGPLPGMPHLEAVDCRSIENGFVIRYVARSELENEFDRRSVTIAFGAGAAAIAEAAGATDPRNPRIEMTTLIEPLHAEGVLRRVMRPRVQHGAWTLFTEQIDYPRRGMEVGYSMDCATALHLEPGRSIAVAECYDLSNRPEFLASVADSEAAMFRVTDKMAAQDAAASSAPKQTP